MRSFTRRERIGVAALLGLIGLIGFYQLLWPRYRRYRRWEGEIRDNLEKIRRARGRIRGVPALRSKLHELENRLYAGRTAAGTPGGFPRLLRRIEATRGRAHIPPENVARIARGVSGPERPGGTGAVARFRSITMENVVRLIWQLRGKQRPVGVQGIRLDPVEVESTTRYDVRLQLWVPLAYGADAGRDPEP